MIKVSSDIITHGFNWVDYCCVNSFRRKSKLLYLILSWSGKSLRHNRTLFISQLNFSGRRYFQVFIWNMVTNTTILIFYIMNFIRMILWKLLNFIYPFPGRKCEGDRLLIGQELYYIFIWIIEINLNHIFHSIPNC